MTKKDTLESLTTILARQAEALANNHGALPRDTVVGMAGEIVNQLLFVASPMAVMIEKESKAQATRRAGGSKYMRGDAKTDFIVALRKYGAACYANDMKPEARGWKKIVAGQLGTRWKDIVPWLTPGRWNMTEADCISIMQEQKTSR